MAGNADPEMDSSRHVARYLAGAFIAQSHGIGMDYAREKYAHMPVGSFWGDIAPQVIAHIQQRGGRPDFSATIQ
jgi:hypothetical protein